MGVDKGVGSPVECRAEGTFMGFHWWAREHRVTSAEAKGGRLSLLSEQPINSGAENTVCLPRLLFPITNPDQGGYGQPETDHTRRL